MKKNVLAAIIIFVLCTACKKAEQPAVEIRVQNHTAENFEAVVLYSNEGERIFGNIHSNAVSGYLHLTGTYEIPVCRFNVSGRNVEFVIRCATPTVKSLAAGKYTYLVTSTGAQQYEINLLKD